MMLRIAIAALFAMCFGAAAQAQTTWNSADCDAGITLSSGDTIATRSAGGWKACRSTTSHNFDGNYIFQLDVFDNGGGGDRGILIGIGDASATLTNYLGSDTHGWSKQINNGVTSYCLTPSLCTFWVPYIGGMTFVSGDTVFVAVDTNGYIYTSKDCSSWYGDPTSHASYEYQVTTANPIYIMASLDAEDGATIERVTIRPGAPGCSGVFPTGYGGWDTAPAPTPALFPGSMLLMGVGQ